MERRKRVSYPLGMFDLVKGIGMIQIVMFHSKYALDVSPWIYYILQATGGGLMGAFYAINGFQFRESSVSMAFKKGVKAYLSQYGCLAVYLIMILLIIGAPVSVLVGYASAFLLGTLEATSIGTLYVENVVFGWFFLALLWGSILLNLILKIKNHWARIVVIAVISMFGVYLEVSSFVYYCICRSCQALPTMYLGYCIYNQDLLKEEATPHKKRSTYFLFAIVIAAAAYIERPEVDVMVFVVTRPLFEMAFGYVSLCVSRDTVHLSNCVVEFIRKIGRYSPWIIIVHSLEHVCFPWYRVLPDASVTPNRYFILYFLYRSIVILLGCVLLTKISGIQRQIQRKYFRKRKNRRCHG